MPIFKIVTFLLSLWLAAAAVSAASAQVRIALVVGNGTYASVPQLDNPVSDATLIAASLEQSGFEVTLRTDTSQVTLKRAIAQFGRDLRAAGPEATGLFYYAGHGVQSFGTNYMIPVDVELTDAADLDLVAIEAQSVLRQMNSARNRTNIVILDACRNNPFENVQDMDDNGLAEMKSPTGTFLSYSTAPGAVALDGLGSNSPFSAALAAAIPSPGVPIEQMFKQVRNAVLKTTNGMQTPWDASSLTADFYFVQAEVLSGAEIADAQLWQSLNQTRDPVQIMLFLRAYPDSAFVDEARALLAQIMQKELSGGAGSGTAAAPVVAAPAPPPILAPADRERELIGLAQASGEIVDYQAYLAAFPDGAYAELARFEISVIEQKAANQAAAVAVATPPATAAPDSTQTATAPATPAGPDAGQVINFDTVLTFGAPEIVGKTIADVVKLTPLFAPVEGLPEAFWKTKTCANCHAWTRETLCDQGKFYLGMNNQRALSKEHPLGGTFKQSLKRWADGGCS